jgi:hypothetical protein
VSNFVNTLFGTIAGPQAYLSKAPNVDFIPLDGKGKTLQIKGQHATWLGLKNRLQQKFAYEYCFPVSSVVDRLAEYDISGIVEILRLGGKGKDDYLTGTWATLMNARLAQPNPLQSWEQFRGQQVVYKKVFGFCPVFPIVPEGMGPEYCTSIINIPPWLFDAKSTKEILYKSSLNEIVKEYTVTILGKSFTLTSEQVFILEDSFLQDEDTDFLLPQSRLVGLDMAVSNVCAAMEADNVVLKKKGPLGVWSHDAAATKDAVAGYIPMTPDEKQELQNDLSRYGLTLSQYQYIISRTAVKYASAGYNVQELGTKATVTQGEQAICHRFGFPYVLYEQTETSFANGKEAAKDVYQNNIIPNNRKDLTKYEKFFKAKENNAKITCDYSHISALQEDELHRAQAKLALNNALEKEWLNNMITRNQYLTALGYDTLPGEEGNVYYRDEKKEPVMKVENEDPTSKDQAA